MKVVIAGGGRVGFFLAQIFESEGHEVVVVEKDEERVQKISKVLKSTVFWADACDPLQFEKSGVRGAEVVVAVTGHDEDNLVICQLAKHNFGAKKVIARVNHPRNSWLYTRDWGADVAVSATHIIADILREEASLGDLITLLRFKGGKVALVERVVEPGSKLIGVKVGELNLPEDSVLVAIVRKEKEEVVFPRGDTVIYEGDRVYALTSVLKERKLAQILGATSINHR